jgi:hypothetical protein
VEFTKKDGTPIELPKRLPKATEGSLIGLVENFEIDMDHSTMLRRCRMSLLITEESVMRAGGLVPTLSAGAKIEIRLVR